MMKSKKALVIDYGIYTEMAVRLMRDCANVYYYNFWENSSDHVAHKIGENLDGMEKIKCLWDYIDKVDFIFCPDTLTGGLVEFLKRHDYAVCGAGKAERLENDRWFGRNLQRDAGLPIQETHPIVGIDKLREFCKEKKNYFIKVDNGIRGLSESFHHINYATSESRIDYIAYHLGPYKNDALFICEEKLEGIEPGLDGITFDGELIYPTMCGYEKKYDGWYIGRVYQNSKELPEAFKIIHNGLAPYFKECRTRMFYSTEMIIDKDRVPFLIDPTLRMASPAPSAIQTEIIDNFSEVVYGLAIGQIINPIMKYKYGASLTITCAESKENFVAVKFPKEERPWIKILSACKKGNDYYSVPPSEPIGCVIGLGNTIQEAIDRTKEHVKLIDGQGLSYNEKTFDTVPEEINEGKRYGISF